MTELVDLNTIRPNATPKLNEALSKAQGAMGLAIKDSNNPHFNSKFADMASCVDVARKPLADNGLAVTQDASTDLTAGTVTVVTTILHASGEERVYSPLTLPVVQKTPQGYGSSLTYCRRYSYCAPLGIAPGDDDDGEAASKAPPSKPVPKPEAKKRAPIQECNASGQPVVTFGPSKGKAINDLTPPELSAAIVLAEERLAASPGATWSAGVSLCLTDLKHEQGARIDKAMDEAKK